MNNSNIVFTLNNDIQIIIEIDQYYDDYPYCFYEDNFYLYYNNKKTKLAYDSIASYIEELTVMLKKSLKNQKKLPNNLTLDIGYLWNLYVNAENDSQLSYANEEYAFLEKFNLWYSKYATWIYNDELGNITLEITPCYPHTYDENFSYQNFLQWMENYQPLLKTIIPKNIAQQWVMQGQQIIDIIDENTEMLHAQGKL